MMDTAIQMFNDWVTDLKEYPPHAWLNDPREPLFTFTLWDGREFGFYAMSLTYWIEICFVRLSCFARFILPNIWPNLWILSGCRLLRFWHSRVFWQRHLLNWYIALSSRTRTQLLLILLDTALLFRFGWHFLSPLSTLSTSKTKFSDSAYVLLHLLFVHFGRQKVSKDELIILLLESLNSILIFTCNEL